MIQLKDGRWVESICLKCCRVSLTYQRGRPHRSVRSTFNQLKGTLCFGRVVRIADKTQEAVQVKIDELLKDPQARAYYDNAYAVSEHNEALGPHVKRPDSEIRKAN